MKALVVLIGLGLLAPASSVFAGSPDLVVPGLRVRLTIATAPGAAGAPLKGTVRSADDATFTVIGDDGPTVSVAREHVQKLEISQGRNGHARKGFLIGALFGAVMGAVLVAGADESFCYLSPCAPATTGEKAALFGFSTVAYGGLGALVGVFVKTERWLDVPLHQPRVQVVPTRGRGIGINVSVAF